MASKLQKITEVALAELTAQAPNLYMEQDGVFGRVPLSIILDKIKSSCVTNDKLNEMLPNLVKKLAASPDGKGLTITYWDDSTQTVEVAGSGGLAFDSMVYDDNGYLHIQMDGSDVVDPVFIGGSGGGGDAGSRLTFGLQSPMTMSVAETAEEANIEFIFRSVDTATQMETGNGTLQISVGGALKKTMSIKQGVTSVNVRTLLSSGSNAISLTITDAYGKTATRKCAISVETLSLSWSLGNTETATDSLIFTLTPIGNYSKTIHILVDDVELESFVVATSGFKQTRTIPKQAHGGHTVAAYCTMDLDGVLLTSETLTCAVAWTDGSSTAPVIACDTIAPTQAQYSMVNLVHRVVDPQNNPTNVEYLVDGKPYKTESIDQSEHTWSYRLSAAGTVTLGIRCGSSTYSITLQVTSIGTDVAEVTDGLKIKLDPAAMTDLQGWHSGEYDITLSENFDQVNGGLMSDAEGIRCIRITAGDRLTLNYPLFAGDARKTGLAAKIIYAVRNSSKMDTDAITCMSEGVGIRIQANNAYLSGNQTTCKMSTCEDMKAELDINIEPDTQDSLMYLWESAGTFAYRKYAVDEGLSQTVSVGITFGSDDADVYLYLFRAYSRDLAVNEIKANYIADGAGAQEILARHNRNDIYDSTGAINVMAAAEKNPDTHIMVIDAARMTLGKKDSVPAVVHHIFKGGGEEHQWHASGTMKVQGTSSVEYADTAGPNINFYFSDGVTLENGTVMAEGYAMHGADQSIPVKEICFKKNIASEDHVVNRASAEWYQRFQPSVREARKKDPRVRDCLESTMCAVFFHNTGSSAVRVGPDLVPPDATIFFGLGNICSNKDSVNAFQYDPIVVEVRNNTSPQVLFKSDDLSGGNFDKNFEFRYLDDSQYTEDTAKAEWQKVQTFLYKTDCTGATDEPLPVTESFGGVNYATDSTEYRKAKWKAEAPNIFDMQTLYFHHNITLFLLLRDNRAKNMFWSKSKESGKWGLWFNWDNDTGLCRNNEGYVDIEPGYMDFDTYGTGNVFNGADNVVFNNIRTWDFEELKANYLDRESVGAWDIEKFYAYCCESQDAICEALWIEDAQHNAIRTMQNQGTLAYLERATGRLRLHIKKALLFQKVMVDSYFNSTAAINSSSSFRGYTPSEWKGVKPTGKVEITTYANMYINILAGSTSYQLRAEAGVPVEVDISAYLNDTEIYVRHAPWIQAFGDLSGLYLGQVEASKLTRVRRLLIGSSVPGYYNTNFKQGSFDNCLKLEELNMGGLTHANRAFDLSPNIYLRKIYTKGSGITGITFAKQGRLQEAQLNAVSSLYMNGLYQLANFELESYEALTSLTMERCPTIDSLAIVTHAPNLSRVRLMGVNWKMPNAELLMRLRNCGGKDDSGYDVDYPVVTGNAQIIALSQSKLDILVAAFPQLEIIYDDITAEWHLRFWNEDKTKVLDDQLIEDGYGGENPVTRAERPIETPVKEPTPYIVYRFAGWSGSYKKITQDTDVLAVFAQDTRYYDVVWLNELVPVQRKQIPAGGNAIYEGEDLVKEGKIWTGWDKAVKNVLSDLDVNATYEVPELPTEMKDTSQFDYIYSDDPADNKAYTFGQFVGIITAGMAKDYFQMYDKIKIVNTWSGIKDESMVLSLHSLGHFEMADASLELAKTTWFMVGVLTAGRAWNASGSNVGGYLKCDLDRWLEEQLFPNLPCHWKAVINPVKILANKGDQSSAVEEGVRHLYLPAYAEMGFGVSEIPYKDEVSPSAQEKRFSYYTGNSQRIKKTFNGGGTAQNYWTRSAYSGSSSAACYIGNNGISSNTYCYYSSSVCVGLSISKIN